MQSQTRGARAILAYIERPYERSPLFQWLLAHHDELIASAGGRRMEWTRFCGTFETAGLTAWDGKPVNAATARKTWQRVRKEDARLEALRAAEGGQDYAFKENGMLVGTDGWSSGLSAKQQLNVRGSRPINDLTEEFYARLGLRSEKS
jgi:hypothetical protein